MAIKSFLLVFSIWFFSANSSAQSANIVWQQEIAGNQKIILEQNELDLENEIRSEKKTFNSTGTEKPQGRFIYNLFIDENGQRTLLWNRKLWFYSRYDSIPMIRPLAVRYTKPKLVFIYKQVKHMTFGDVLFSNNVSKNIQFHLLARDFTSDRMEFNRAFIEGSLAKNNLTVTVKSNWGDVRRFLYVYDPKTKKARWKFIFEKKVRQRPKELQGTDAP